MTASFPFPPDVTSRLLREVGRRGLTPDRLVTMALDALDDTVDADPPRMVCVACGRYMTRLDHLPPKVPVPAWRCYRSSGNVRVLPVRTEREAAS